MVIPRVVLYPEGLRNVFRATAGKVLICEVRVVHVASNLLRQLQRGIPRDHGRQFCGLQFDVLEPIAQLRLGALGIVLRQFLHALHQRIDGHLGLRWDDCYKTDGSTLNNISTGGLRDPIENIITFLSVLMVVVIMKMTMFVFSLLGYNIVVFDPLTRCVQFLGEPTGEYERRQGMEVGQQDDRVHHLG